MNRHICKYCGDQFENRIKSSDVCKRRTCQRAQARDRYHSTFFTKECSVCGKIFDGKRQETVCENCKENKGDLYSPEYTVRRDVICYRCDSYVKTEYINSHTNSPSRPIHKGLLCDKCLTKSRNNMSQTKLGEKNPNWKGGVSLLPPMMPDEVSRRSSQRMKINNPMRDPLTKLKVSKTLKNGYKTGRYKKLTGEQHWLWKGNRKRSYVIRSRLYNIWIKPIMIRDNFSCQRCGKIGGYLEVHHKHESFSDIVHRFNEKGGSLNDLSSEEFESLSEIVTSYHENNLNIGETLCRKCHRAVDPMRF